ncbi:MAG: carbohydrate kinase [Bacteroidales bacterium]|nr:carbohydrate kinase [Bacteroidales bacterium]
MSRMVAGIGEMVLDIVFREGQPQAAVPGGSVFNSMVSLGRTLGRTNPDVRLVMDSQTGDDAVADIMTEFMLKNGLSTDGIQRVHGQSAVSMAMLDANNNAHYEFFRDKTLPPFELPSTRFEADDIMLFGSVFAVNPGTAPQTRALARRAQEAGGIVYYDINFRKNHPADPASIEENIALCDIVRGSSEDIEGLYGTSNAAKVYEERIAPLCHNFICTHGGKDAEFFSPGVHLRLPVPHVEKIVSTIGAGDNFNAGTLYAIVHHGFTKARLAALTEDDWRLLSRHAMAFSANVCASMFNYVDPDFIESL